ncbi:hypothetical protein [Longimicrobium terrae]|uniref:MFS family permease n=1 Tax=Longimicrobium terrae TaxID=1639882 RepID=A0A841H6J2_9BACT|nr:hypothetical protein [Longimicrobium terrae]MBB4639331.1 MFS family permease [Longimicrobium terrae]MBB6073598.1 MFS family permease [Longimicrobium terrae]NNC29395.1 hypothetical protein [Longimicrobium terrae]
MNVPALRPLSVGEILDGAFKVYRNQFGTMLGTSMALYLPLAAFQLVAGAMTSSMTAGSDINPAAALTASLLALLAMPLWVVCFVAMFGALTYQASRAYMGQPVSPRDSIRHGFSRFFSLLGALFLMSLCIGVGFLGLVIGAVFVWIMLFAVIPAVVVEGRGAVESLTRSQELARGAWGPIFLVLLVAVIITGLPGWAVQILTSLQAEPGTMSAAIGAAASTVVGAITAPFSIAATVVLYYDRRVKAEALDVHLAAGMAGA